MDSLEVSIKYEIIHKCIQSLWQKEFNSEGIVGPNIVTMSKKECAEHYYQRLIFCDKYKPKLKTKSSDYTESEFIRIQYMDRLKMCIIDDIKKIPGLFDLINKLYF
jgi:tRNA A22 N-methylase